MQYCDEKSWHDNNVKAYSWYLETYPFLQSFTLPISFFTLKRFYTEDMKRRNLEPQEQVLQCYENVFSYFLANYDQQQNPNRPTGNTDLGYILNAIPEGLSNTVTQISSVLDSGKWIFFALLLLLVFFFYIKIK